MSVNTTLTPNPNSLLVCGGGLGGLSAAVTALEHGARVTLIEKAPELGGTTALSGGLLWTFADYEVARAKIPQGDAALQWLVFEDIGPARAWLAGMGATLGPVEPVLFHGQGQSADPQQLIALLAARFAALGGTLRLATALEGLVTDEAGAVIGARVVHEGRHETIAAGAVILATGGFQGNHELLARYVVRDPDNLLLRSNPWSTGDAFLAATAIGAAASPGLDNFYGHALAYGARYRRDQLRDVSQYHGFVSVALNLDGERFADETDWTGEEALTQRMARQEKGRAVYIVDDTAMTIQPIQGRPSITRTILERARAAGGTVLECDTIEELCRQLGAHGFPPQRCLATLREFNRHMEEGLADELRPSRQRHRNPLAVPPYRAVVVQAAITFTTGGIAIDEHTRVLRRAGSNSPFAPAPVERAYVDNAAQEGPMLALGNDYRQTVIPGLYAVGCDAGNISHFGYMGGLSAALTTGRSAGRSAARYAGATDATAAATGA